MPGIPFAMGGEFDDETRVCGHVSLGRGSLALELGTGPRGERLSVPRKVVIGVEEFTACRFRRGLMHDRVVLRAASVGALAGIPGVTGESVTLRFSKRYREAAEALAHRFSAVVGETHPEERSGLFRVASSL